MATQYEINGKAVSKEEYEETMGFFNGLRGNKTSNAPKDGVRQVREGATAKWASYDADWRVKLGYKSGTYNDILAPLSNTGGMIFPYTPTVIINHTANYDSLHPVHSNYPFYAYQNSQVDQITITGQFVQQTAADAEYWVAAIHFLRSASKMAYGQSTNQGNPPPLLKLDGYGQFVFNNIPVILQTFMVDLPQDVDYIETSFGGGGTTHVPVNAQISITVVPQYSRSKVEAFSLDKYVSGGYLKSGEGYL